MWTSRWLASPRASGRREGPGAGDRAVRTTQFPEVPPPAVRITPLRLLAQELIQQWRNVAHGECWIETDKRTTDGGKRTGDAMERCFRERVEVPLMYSRSNSTGNGTRDHDLHFEMLKSFQSIAQLILSSIDQVHRTDRFGPPQPSVGPKCRADSVNSAGRIALQKRTQQHP